MLHSYHSLVGWSHQTGGELHHQRSRTSETLLQRQKKNIVTSNFRNILNFLPVYEFVILTWDL